MRLTGVRAWCHTGEAQVAHQPLYTLAIDRVATLAQGHDHAPGPIERVGRKEVTVERNLMGWQNGPE